MAMTPCRGRLSNATAASSVTMAASDDDPMEEASVFSLSSPPRSASKSSAATALFEENQSTPRSSRRLFGDEEEEHSFGETKVPTLTPFPSRPKRRVTRPMHQRQDSMDSQDLSGRKRSSDERREAHENDMQTSPHVSPHTYMTMDGNVVYSKNPFSSPMVTEDDHPPQALVAGAPSFPLHLASVSATPASPHRPPTVGLLPPRHAKEKRATYNRDFNASKFTGSPIPEHTRPAGSLLKVRRLHRDDDVVSATHPRPSLSVDTSDLSFSDSDNDDDRISPTDVLSLAPTPAKRYRAPPTPVAQRRHEKLVQRRTPHPGSILRRHRADDEHAIMSAAAKSRFYDDFDIIQELGKGSFGTVYQVLSRLDGCMYAIKAAQRQAKGATDRDRMLKEVYALAALSDQADTATFHIVRYHQAWMEDNRLFIQTELCQGNLAKEMLQNRLNLPRRYKLLREMCLALAFLHRHHMVHLDIKPENIFIKNDQFKLGDFGLVSKSSSHEDVEEGDSRYMSLELLSGDHSDLTKSDIFSLGATLYEICRGQPLPMNGPEWQEMRHGQLQHIHEDGITVDADLVQFVHQMMDANPHARPSADTLLNHPKLLSDDQKALLAERHKVEQANLALQRLSPRPPPSRPRPFGKGLQRSATWSGHHNSAYF